MKNWSSYAVALLGVVAVPLGSLQSQSAASRQAATERVLRTATCTSCRITTQKVGQLGGDGGPSDDAAGFSDLKMLADGSVLAAPVSASEVWVLDVKGAVKKRIGRAGDGPGEFRKVWSVHPLTADTFLVYDQNASRISTFTLDGRFHREMRVPAFAEAAMPLGRDQVVLVGRLTSANRPQADAAAVFPLHIARRDTIRVSFGEVIRKVDPRERFQFSRVLVPYKGTIIAVNRSYRYVIDRWDARGKMITRYVREADWFKPFDNMNPGDPAVEPSPFVEGAWVDSADRLWVILAKPAPTWRGAFTESPAKGEGGKPVRRMTRPDLYFTGVVEVFDLKKGTLIASAPLPFEARYALGDNVVAVMRRTVDDEKYLELYRLTLQLN